MAYSVEQRTQEIGIRLALGAQAAQVKNMVVLQGMRLAVVGVVVGRRRAFGLARLIAAFLFGVTARDPLVFVGVPLLLATVALLAVWLPARRASRWTRSSPCGTNSADALSGCALPSYATRTMSRHHPAFPCCHCAQHPRPAVEAPLVDPFTANRRRFLASIGGVAAGCAVLGAWRPAAAAPARAWAPERRPLERRTLVVQPALTYEIPQRREATSWRNWGGIQTEDAAQKERQWIEGQLSQLEAQAGFPLEFRPVALVKDIAQAEAVARGDFDVMLIYGAGGWVNLLETLTVPGKWNVMFLRHDPGPAYLWYEIVSPRFLRKTVDEYGQPGWSPADVVVDRHDELLWRLRSLSGLKNTLGKRIVCVGGAAGWGDGGEQAPARTRETWKMEMVDYPYTDLGPRIKAARQKGDLAAYAQEGARRLLKEDGVSLHTGRDFVNNAFVLTEVFKDVMDEADADAITINSCMGTIMPMSETTACLPLSLLNDDGYLAFCESDFVVIPSGILLHYISGLPVFLNDPTYPHDDIVTLAHCTAPRKMDGRRAERTKILTHFESDYGAAPKVEMKIGQVCTNLVPDFGNRKWVGFEGTIVANPFLDICRSQIDVRIHGESDLVMDR